VEKTSEIGTHVLVLEKWISARLCSSGYVVSIWQRGKHTKTTMAFARHNIRT